MDGHEGVSGVPSLVVCDAGPLIHLHELRSLDLLADFSGVLVPDGVWAEVSEHRAIALTGTEVKLTRVASAKPPSMALQTLARSLSLHRGELEALGLADERSDCILLTDDTAARLAAASLGLTVHGTLGVLIRAIRRHHRTREQVMSALRSIPTQTTLHVKPSLLAEVIARVEKLA